MTAAKSTEEYLPPEPPEKSLGEMAGNLLRTIRRRRWWIILPATLVPVLVAGVVMLLPDRYESDATLMVLQSRVSQRYVEPAVPVNPTEAFFSMNRDVLSRTKLLKIVDDFGLYPKEREKGYARDRLAEIMRKDISLEPLDYTRAGEIVSFRMGYSAESPELAQKVAERLANLFIEENQRSRNTQAETTARFLTEQIDSARQRMVAQEQKVRDYKVKNLEQLPQQQQALLGTLTDLRIQSQSLSSNQVRMEQQRGNLRLQIGNQLNRLEEDRREMLTKFTAKHPLVVKKDAEIERLRTLMTKLTSGKGSGEVTSPDGVDDPQIAQLRVQVEDNLAELQDLQRQRVRIEAEIAKNQGLLRLTPVREQELTDILRDYDLYKKDYGDLLDKKLNADLSANLEQRNEGQQFRVVDAPAVPSRPTSPKRMKISLGAIAGGLALGLLLAFLIEMRTQTFYSERDVKEIYAGVPLIIALPKLSTPAEEIKGRRRTISEWAAALCLCLVLGAAQLYVYWNG